MTKSELIRLILVAQSKDWIAIERARIKQGNKRNTERLKAENKK